MILTHITEKSPFWKIERRQGMYTERTPKNSCEGNWKKTGIIQWEQIQFTQS